jgi:hypothetical protein
VQGAGDHLFVAGEFLGLAALNVRNPSHPIQVGHYPLGTGEDEGWDVHVVGNQAYLARGYHGLLVFEVVESPYIKSVRRSGNNLVLSWNGAPGLRLQRTPSLNSPAWTDVVESAGASEISLPIGAGSEFYRLANTPTNATITVRR